MYFPRHYKIYLEVILLGLTLLFIAAAFKVLRGQDMAPALPEEATEETFSETDFVCRDCNLILISLDSLRADHLSLYGYRRETAPNLTKWAKDAFVFNDYITTSYLTPISEASLHTGLYPRTNGVIDFVSDITEAYPTLAEILKSAGYRTAAIGSSPEFMQEELHGEEVSRKFLRRGFDEVFPDLVGYHGEWESRRPLPTEELRLEEYAFPRIRRGLPFAAMDWLKKRDQGEKFFLWMPIGTVHWPYAGKPFVFSDRNYRGVFRDDPLDWASLSWVFEGALWGPGQTKKQTLQEADTRFIRDRYDDGIFLVDQFLGQFFAALDRLRFAENTIVIISSEHGEDLGEHGYFAHYDVFDTQVRAPLIVKAPGLLAKRIPGQISTVDILPTLLEILDITHPRQNELEGKSFARILTGEENRELRPYAFIDRTPLWEHVIWMPGQQLPDWQAWLLEFHERDAREHFHDVAVRTKDWKLIYRKSRNVQRRFSWWNRLTGRSVTPAEYELYNLRDDPLETQNVFSKYPKITRLLGEKLRLWLKEMESRPFPGVRGSPFIQPYF